MSLGEQDTQPGQDDGQEEMRGRRQKSLCLWLGQGWAAGGAHPSSWHTTGLLGLLVKGAAWVRLGVVLPLGLLEGVRQIVKLCPPVLKPFFSFPR